MEGTLLQPNGAGEGIISRYSNILIRHPRKAEFNSPDCFLAQWEPYLVHRRFLLYHGSLQGSIGEPPGLARHHSLVLIQPRRDQSWLQFHITRTDENQSNTIHPRDEIWLYQAAVKQDHEMKEVIGWARTSRPPWTEVQKRGTVLRAYWRLHQHLQIQKGLLWMGEGTKGRSVYYRLCIPESLQDYVLRQHHRHAGQEDEEHQMIEEVSRHVYFPEINKAVRRYLGKQQSQLTTASRQRLTSKEAAAVTTEGAAGTAAHPIVEVSRRERQESQPTAPYIMPSARRPIINPRSKVTIAATAAATAACAAAAAVATVAMRKQGSARLSATDDEDTTAGNAAATDRKERAGETEGSVSSTSITLPLTNSSDREGSTKEDGQMGKNRKSDIQGVWTVTSKDRIDIIEDDGTFQQHQARWKQWRNRVRALLGRRPLK